MINILFLSVWIIVAKYLIHEKGERKIANGFHTYFEPRFKPGR